MDLSVAVIVKNEEKNIRRMLESLEPLKEKLEMEVIIVDTGSTDNTISIAREYTDNVYEHKWNDNFADMRNISLDYCKGEWILVLDADEKLIEYNDLIRIVRDKKNTGTNMYQIICRSFIDSECNQFIDSYIPRLLKKGIRYKGKLHELPKEFGNCMNSNITIYHYGYIKDDCRLMEYKFERNMKHLLENRRMNIDVENTNYHIYNLYSMFGMFDNAMAEIKSQYYSNDKKKYEIAIRYGIELFKAGEYIKAINILEKLYNDLSPNNINIDVNYFLGFSYYYMKNYSRAIKYLEEYLNDYDTKSNVELYSVGRQGEVKRLLSICLYNLDKYNELINVYEQIEDYEEAAKIKDIYVYSLLKCNMLKDYYVDKEINDVDIELITRSIERYNYVEIGSWIELAYKLLGINRKLDYVISRIYLGEKHEYDLNDIVFEDYYDWKGKLLKILVREKYDIIFNLSSLSDEILNKYIQYLLSDNYCLNRLYDLSRNNFFESDIDRLRIITIVEKNILLYKNIDFNDYDDLIYRAAVNSINYTLNKYNKLYIENNTENINKYEAMWFKIRNMVKCINKKEYLEKFKCIMEENKEYARMLKRFNLTTDMIVISDEMILEKQKVLIEIEELISKGELKEPLEALKELLNIFNYDEEILMDIGVVYYIMGDIDEAMRYLIKAYFVNSDNEDIRYNLECVLEVKGYRGKESLEKE